MSDTLPKIKNRKMINMKEFSKLAKKVVKSFEEQEAFLRKRNEQYGHHHTTGFSPIS